MTNRSVHNMPSLEVNKLDLIDQKVLAWLLNHRKSSVAGWIQYVTQEYRHKGIEINAEKLSMEVERTEEEV